MSEQALLDALAFYADRATWRIDQGLGEVPAYEDGGRRARSALAAQEQEEAGQGDLFASSPTPKARTTDPATSKAAAKQNAPRAGSQRHRILCALLVDRSEEGMIAAEFPAILGIPLNSVSTRLSELEAGGFVYVDGDPGVTPTGAEAQLYHLTPTGARAAREPRSREEKAHDIGDF